MLLFSFLGFIVDLRLYESFRLFFQYFGQDVFTDAQSYTDFCKLKYNVNNSN